MQSIANRPGRSTGSRTTLTARLFAVVIGAAAVLTPMATAQAAPPAFIACPAGDYENVDHACVPSPGQNSDGATAQCRDGSYSYSQHRRGTCSHHGGVERWF
ncbi:hypothetical protein DUF 3761 [Nocardia nova SH22a]|uniref:DUF3761 domain-containing protein n=1 Tax=Nocardia nova SH22a TaxID=1415166 RepID=W5TDI3_9NOCA|nr:DUF3761 domain-containing protein [Nocardia nova]AHH17370.1 hypothetical protein DUF 3761 [Nocardia nova SH22a]